MKPLILDGITYDKEFVESLKEIVKSLRDASMKCDPPRFDYTVPLCHVHAVLCHYQRQLEEKE